MTTLKAASFRAYTTIEMVTTRGLHDGGAQERGLANDYRSSGDRLKFEWLRTASLLVRIARSFEDTAKYHDENAEFADWTY